MSQASATLAAGFSVAGAHWKQPTSQPTQGFIPYTHLFVTVALTDLANLTCSLWWTSCLQQCPGTRFTSTASWTEDLAQPLTVLNKMSLATDLPTPDPLATMAMCFLGLGTPNAALLTCLQAMSR